jgi:hypothetical protein
MSISPFPFDVSLKAVENSKGETMRFMIIVKANAESEAGVMPDQKMLDAMADYHQDLQKAGVLLDASALVVARSARAERGLR